LHFSGNNLRNDTRYTNRQSHSANRMVLSSSAYGYRKYPKSRSVPVQFGFQLDEARSHVAHRRNPANTVEILRAASMTESATAGVATRPDPKLLRPIFVLKLSFRTKQLSPQLLTTQKEVPLERIPFGTNCR